MAWLTNTTYYYIKKQKNNCDYKELFSFVLPNVYNTTVSIICTNTLKLTNNKNKNNYKTQNKSNINPFGLGTNKGSYGQPRETTQHLLGPIWATFGLLN